MFDCAAFLKSSHSLKYTTMIIYTIALVTLLHMQSCNDSHSTTSLSVSWSLLFHVPEDNVETQTIEIAFPLPHWYSHSTSNHANSYMFKQVLM